MDLLQSLPGANSPSDKSADHHVAVAEQDEAINESCALFDDGVTAFYQGNHGNQQDHTLLRDHMRQYTAIDRSNQLNDALETVRGELTDTTRLKNQFRNVNFSLLERKRSCDINTKNRRLVSGYKKSSSVLTSRIYKRYILGVFILFGIILAAAGVVVGVLLFRSLNSECTVYFFSINIF